MLHTQPEGFQLEELIGFLEQVPDQDHVCPIGFDTPHSYRGNYSDLAFCAAENVTVAAMLACAKSALGESFTGYKGGTFRMSSFSNCYIVWDCSNCYGETLGRLLMTFIVNAPEGSIK